MDKIELTELRNFFIESFTNLYGVEWEKEIQKLDKDTIIEMLRSTGRDNFELKKKLLATEKVLHMRTYELVKVRIQLKNKTQ